MVCIVGPTAVGKTDFTLAVARRIGAEVISADSMQVYRGLDIGTAKPDPAERAAVPHHLIDIVDPREPFSVADWVGLARRLILEIGSRGKTPLVSGGTPLYFESLFGRYQLAAGVGADAALRGALTRQAQRFGPQYLSRKLSAVDPVAAERIHPADQKRTIRALEVYLVSGRPISEANRRGELRQPTSRSLEPEPLVIGLWRPREELYRRIEARVHQMLEAGLVGEVERLMALGCRPEMTSMQGVGYKELAAHLRGELSLPEAVRLIVRNTRRLAKRQMTWFRRDERIRWIRPGMNIQGSVEDVVTWWEEKHGG